MYPKTSNQGGFYPADEVIPTQTARNRDAILYLIQQAACPTARDFSLDYLAVQVRYTP